jgi:ribonuclease PH
VALADAVAWLRARRSLAKPEPLVTSVAAVSVGVIDGEPRLDLPYVEDVAAGTDMNVVCTGAGEFVEVQGTAEGAAFDRATLDALLDLAVAGCARLTEIQRAALAG